MIAPSVRHSAKRRRLRALAVGLAAAAVVACEPGDAPREIAEAQEPTPVAPAPAALAPALPETPSAPAEPPEAGSTTAEVAPRSAAPRTAPERPAPTPAAEPRVEAAAAPDPLAPSHPPLDILLQAPHESGHSSRPIDLDPAAPSSAEDEAAPPGTLDRWANHLWLERRSDLLGPNGREGTLWETDAGVRIPVDKSLSLEGGVRVDQREQPGAQEPDRRSTPRVGVEVRF